MRTERFEFAGCNQTMLPAVLWLPEGKPKALLQITHGMTEHIGRYEAFASEMTEWGIAVAGFDLRGHGRNAGNPDVASFGEGGWEASLQDMKCFYDLLEARFPGVRHYLHGFSLGSFLLREYLGIYPGDTAGAVIMGTGWQPSFVLSVIMKIVKNQGKKAGFDNTTDLVRTLSFGTYNQKFKPNRTTADWLCSDSAQLDAYLADPLVRKDISAGLFWQLLGAMKRTGERGACGKWRKDMPVLMICGAEDPVGDMGKGAVAVRQRMEADGLQNVTWYLLDNARHMLLQEKASGAAEESCRKIRGWILQN